MKLELVTIETNIDYKRSPLISISSNVKKAMVIVNRAQIEWINKLSRGLTNKQLTEALELLSMVREPIE